MKIPMKESLSGQNKVKATPSARRAAREIQVSLEGLYGSGPNGRIHLIDVMNIQDAAKFRISPLARRIAKSNELDLDTIQGSGYRNKIMKEDIMFALDSASKEEIVEVQNYEHMPTGHESTDQERFNDTKGRLVPLNAMRETIARRMSESVFTAPSFTIHTEVDMSVIKGMKAQLSEAVMKETGVKLTITDLIVMAVAKTLKNHPVINSAWTDDGIFYYDEINVALAVGLEEGLYVPVIRDADRKSLSQLSIEAKSLSKKVLEGKLKPSEQEGNTFTISNMGMFGITSFNPIINMPSSAILGVSASVDRVVPVDGEPVIRPIMDLALTLDHRVVDGMPGALFLKDLKNLLEKPYAMLI